MTESESVSVNGARIQGGYVRLEISMGVALVVPDEHSKELAELILKNSCVGSNANGCEHFQDGCSGANGINRDGTVTTSGGVKVVQSGCRIPRFGYKIPKGLLTESGTS